jgi:hypothetical protein
MMMVVIMVRPGMTCGRLAVDHGKLVVRLPWIAESLQ